MQVAQPANHTHNIGILGHIIERALCCKLKRSRMVLGILSSSDFSRSLRAAQFVNVAGERVVFGFDGPEISIREFEDSHLGKGVAHLRVPGADILDCRNDAMKEKAAKDLLTLGLIQIKRRPGYAVQSSRGFDGVLLRHGAPGDGETQRCWLVPMLQRVLAASLS
jgi:hypothetical protein